MPALQFSWAIFDPDLDQDGIAFGFDDGRDILSFVDTANITSSWGASTGRLTLSGPDTVANYQSALRAVRFENSSDLPATTPRTVSFTVNDGDVNSNTATRGITVTSVNDAPVNVVPATQTMVEDSSLVFNAANSNLISTTDLDENGEDLELTLTATGGVITLGSTVDIIFTVGDGTADATMTFSGNIFEVNAALDGLVFVGAPDFDATATLQIHADDLGNSGIGGAMTDTDVVSINVTPVNDASVLGSVEGTPIAYTENDGAVAITSSLTVADVDDAYLESASVQITGNYQVGQDFLSFANTANIFASWDTSTGTLLLTGTDTVANYQAAIRAVTYSNLSENPSVAVRTLSFTANDGDVDSNTVTRDIAITAVNDAPIGLGESYSTTAGIAIVENTPGLLANDFDFESNPISALLISGPAHGDLILSSDGSFSYTPHDGFLGSDSFVYAGTDGMDSGTPITVSITVTEFIPEPLSAAQSTEMLEVTPVVTTVSNFATASEEDDIRRVEASEEEQAKEDRIALRHEHPERSAGFSRRDNREDSARQLSDEAKLGQRSERFEIESGDEMNAERTDWSVFWDEQSEQRHHTEESDLLGPWGLVTMTGVTAAVTVGYVLWTLRTGYVVSSFFAAAPAWRSLDILPLLDFQQASQVVGSNVLETAGGIDTPAALND